MKLKSKLIVRLSEFGKLICIFFRMIVFEIDPQFPGDKQSFISLDRIKRKQIRI